MLGFGFTGFSVRVLLLMSLYRSELHCGCCLEGLGLV